MATNDHTMDMATDGPIMVMVMGVAGVTERGRNTTLIRGFNRSQCRPRPGTLFRHWIGPLAEDKLGLRPIARAGFLCTVTY